MFVLPEPYTFAPALHNPFACRGIWPLVEFCMNEKYPAGMSVDELNELVETTISRVAQLDPRVALPVRVALIDSESGAGMVRDED